MEEPRGIVFDLMGTLLDFSALDPDFRREFGGSRVRQEWFREALNIEFVITASGKYEKFSKIAEAALKVVAERHQRKLGSATRKRILMSMRTLPLFPDVIPALAKLSSRGFHLAILTNSSEQAAQEALSHAAADRYFTKVLSADKTKRLKPARETYQMAARQMKLKPGKMLFVAAHSWDLFGAGHAGFKTAFVRRPDEVLDELTPKPDYIVDDLRQLADRL